ncbi:MAG: helix-turn-helix domain-containing protein [Caldilineaceae bacterium]|nr:helix-turn-helix domain-containing protein [Caldilineaceae bacterium]
MNRPTDGEGVHSFGDWLRQQRKARDWSQPALAERVGCTSAMIRKIEADERKPSAQLAALLAAALEISDEMRANFLQVARQLQPIAYLTATRPTPTSARIPAPIQLPRDPLPVPMTSLIDRRRDTAIVTALLTRADVRLLTLLGPPGIGKTRLAIHSAEKLAPHFADGICFVDLSPLTDAQLVLPAIAQALSIAETGTTPLLDRLCTLLQERVFLLVLDNCEQVSEAAVEIGALLRGGKGLKILATSRTPLLLAGEHEYALPTLSLPRQDAVQTIGPEQLLVFEAVQLFAARVRQHRHEFAITAANASEVARICLRLDGLPLALELAAAALRRMSLGQLSEMLHTDPHWLSELHTPARDLPPRQRTLHQAIGWSYGLLNEDRQRVFRRLGIFVGGSTLAAAHAICDASQDELDALADHSLLVRLPGRWTMLEMIREFALSQMTDTELALVQQRHIAWFSARADQKLAHSLADIRQDHDNFRRALVTAIAKEDAQSAYRLCIKLVWYWELHGHLREGICLVHAALALSVDTPLRFELLERMSTLAFQTHEFDIATEFAGQLQSLALAHNDPLERARVLNLQGRILIEQGDLYRAEAVLQESEQIARRISHIFNPGCPLAQLGELALIRGERETARGHWRAALPLLTSAEGDLYAGIFIAMAHTGLAELALTQNDPAQARHELRQVLPYARLYLRRLHCLLVALAGHLLTSAPTASVPAAVKLLAAVDGISERTGDTLSPFHQRLIAERSAAAQQLLPPHEWRTTWQVGHAWTPAQAIAEVERWLVTEPAQ